MYYSPVTDGHMWRSDPAMQITVLISCNEEMKQEEQHIFIWSLLSAPVSGLGDGGDMGFVGGINISRVHLPLWTSAAQCQKTFCLIMRHVKK